MMSDKERQELIKYINSLQSQLKNAYGNAYRDVFKLTEIKNAIKNGADFTWQGNKVAENKLNDILKQLSNKTQSIILNGITGAKELGIKDANNRTLLTFEKTKYNDEVKATMEAATNAARKNVMSTYQFANQKKGGLTLSDRVWNLTGNAKKEIEIIIQNRILEGKSADNIAKDITKYLNEPDRLFRRIKVQIKDKEGNVVGEEFKLSKAAKAYHPGQGVYRSSYKNALRLARTEINAAYLTAEWQSYQNNPLIIGFEVRLSNNHTTLIKGIPTPFRDICDDLQGKYPKTFKFTGWHPQCRCGMFPIRISDDDLEARWKARMENKLQDWKPSEEIKQPPKDFTKWIIDNQSRIETAKQLPYWYMDNYKMIDLAVKLNNNKIGTLTPAITPAKISESADKDDNDKILYEKINQIESNIRKNKFETGVAIDEKGNIIINKRGQQYSISFTNEEIAKIKNTIFTHNHPSGLQYEDKSIRRTGNSFSWEDINLAIKSNVKEIRAVTPVLTFSMKRPANGWPDLEKAKALFISQNATVKNNYMKYVEKLNYSEQAIARAETMHFHTVWKEWVKSFKKMGIDIEYTNRRTL